VAYGEVDFTYILASPSNQLATASNLKRKWLPFYWEVLCRRNGFFYTCISGMRERRRHNKKVYMVITILSAAGKKKAF